jgi:predicted transcriptional regulator
LIITGRQLRAARALLGMEQIELAKRSRVAVGTIRRMESFDEEVGARTSTLSQVQKALEKAGVEFLNDGQPGVRLKRTPGKV